MPARFVTGGRGRWGTRLILLMTLPLLPILLAEDLPNQTFDIDEEQQQGTYIGTIGQNLNGIVLPVTFVSPDSEIDNSINLDTGSGILTTKRKLDRETKDRYNFFVSDQSSNYINIIINLIDINDNTPTFANDTQRYEIPEGKMSSIAKTPLGRVRDTDVGTNGIQSCRIVSGNEENKFQLETRPVGSFDWFLDLLITKEFDYENKSEYLLIIKAVDGGNPRRTGELRVEISVTDINDNQPQFTHSKYQAKIQENATVGTSVLKVSASDLDSGENGKVSYRLDSKNFENSKYFRVDPITGVVRVNKPLDYETIPKFVISVIAEDNGSPPQIASAALQIDLENINELPANITLVFLESKGNKTGRISEDAQEGTLVARISISDPDSPKDYFDANVELLGGEGIFGLRESSGIVYLEVIAKPPDREVKPYYNLTIIATDSGIPPLHASYSFTIWIEDVNDNDPYFTQQIYRAEIHEVAEPGTSVVKASATDPDDGVNAQIIYSILDDTYSSWFSIDRNTGLITTNSAIDCEIESEPTLTVLASDGGKPPRIATATVIISVRDVNDKQPEFDQSFYSASVPENKGVGECILQVSALDPECGQNAPVSYEMDALGPQEFRVDPNTGQLCVARELDYEEKPIYNFMIKASDREGLSTTTLVRVSLLDVNDNVPEFDPANYKTSFREGLPLQALLTVHAKDRDEGRYGTITYSITQGNTQGFFSINPSNGVISLVKPFPLGQRQYSIRVQATDGGGRNATQPATVDISITGANTFPPSFNFLLYNYSISEGAPRGSVVGMVLATSDMADATRVKYEILSGGNNSFAVGLTSGTISTTGALDRERATSMLLSIEAEAGNPPTYAYAQVNITILDVNDNSPAFTINFLEINEREDRDATSSIYVVQATDGDNERNGTLQFSIEDNPGNMFRIDPMSGEIRLNMGKQFDYERQQRYEMKIIAADMGIPTSLSSTMTLVVNVKDINDNPPVFAKTLYHFNVNESIPLTISFAQINATDVDSDENGRVFYMFKNSMFSSVFGINPPNGNIYVKKALDREQRDTYDLTVIASDHGKPSRLTATTQVKIHVVDQNDNDPKCSRESYHFNIQEDLPIGSTVGHIFATDADIGENAKLRYTFENEEPKFYINPNSGEITTMERLDREKKSEEKLIVIVSDYGNPPRSATTSVSVDILDINDNAPEFERDISYTATVQENKPKETKVLQVIATDQDAGENGTISYVLENGPGETSAVNNFAIHSSSGWITTKEVLDFETKKQYKLTVVAKDKGNPPLDTKQTVIVAVGDDNDEAPLFHAKNITFDIVENSGINSFVGQVKAHDRDSGENGRISYYIISGNVFGLFTVDRSSGDITTIRDIDYEESSSHTLGIRAVDNNVLFPKSSNISVTVRVIDVNDNSPIFEQDPVLLKTVKENTPIGHAVYTFTATDKDSGVNGSVEYTIASESHSGPNPEAGHYFRIDKSSGQLKVAKNLDYERVHQIELIVQAHDKCPSQSCVLNASVTTIVYVIDVNDNYPKFESPTSVDIFEDEDLDYPVLYVLATDKDSNENNSGNNLITYKILSGNLAAKFSLESTTGLLTIANPLDREEVSSYALNISAEDHGSPKRISHKILNIDIQDVNDNAPHFSNSTYHASVLEHGRRDDSILRVQATDMDMGDNAKLTYLIPAGIADDKFSIDPVTGVVSTTGPLDREHKDTYIVSVNVRDGGYPTKYDQATIIVNVKDINDNSPVFKTQTSRLHIPENSRQTAIFTFAAYDADTGVNAEIVYSITDGNDEGKFSINAQTGDLSCEALDRESTDDYNLTITATDKGSPPLSGESRVFITVMDENDNDPQFSRSVYVAEFLENINKGEIILQVMASDADKDHNGDVTYSLGNDTEGLFTVNATSGEIITTGLFDREKKAKYLFNIMAMDGGVSGQRNSTAKVEVTIDDINDNTPVFVKVPYRATVSPTASSGTKLLSVEAYDPDAGPNGQVEFEMSTQDWFEMRGADIVTKRNMASSQVGYHNIPIVVRDRGNPALSSTGVVEITVGSPPDQSLSFTEQQYGNTVSENIPNGSSVLQVRAVSQSGAQVSYKFAGGANGDPFHIDPNNGMITVHNTNLIDYETNQQMRLIVQANTASSQDYATVMVNLTDFNDNPPKFTQHKYYTSVWENNLPGTYVTQLQANDADSGNNQQVIYSIIDGNKDNMFSIDLQHTGIITTNEDMPPLDREVRSSYQLLIEAKDSGTPSLSSSCVLSITINDENDNVPFFPSYGTVEISENKTVGSHVIPVTATDVDYQPKLVYSFQDNSNGDGHFSIDRFSGSISLAKPLDYEIKNSYVLGIAVSDGKHNAFTQIDIRVIDENDNAPEFSQQNYQVALEELTPSGTSVITVNATDADTGNNKRITYRLLHDSFYINPDNGTIFTNKSLTYEAFSSIIELVVIAQDGGNPSLSDMVAVHIQITDINKHSPQFDQTFYVTNISEFSVRGESLLHVHATDSDISHGHRDDNINYKLIGSGADTFQIRRKTGEIFLMSQVNRENVSQYNLTAIATDRGHPPRSTSVSVTIIVLDENDNPPRFHQTDNIFHVELPEDYPPVQAFEHIVATDADAGLHSEIQYTITSGNTEGIFHIHGTNGSLFIMLGAHLDYEKSTFHRLIVRAVDCVRCEPIKPRWSAFVTIEINVTDVNEYSPIFPISPYVECVKENQPPGSPVFQAQANDKDGGKYGVLRYAIIPNVKDASSFRINSQTGHVTTTKTFDYENRTYYNFKITAKDITNSTKEVDVTVKIIDVDEFMPKFEKESYNFSVKGSAKNGTYVGRVRASDEDGGSAGNVVFMIKFSDDYFKIDPKTGNITVWRSFHEEAPQGLRRKKRALTGEETTLIVKAYSGREDSLEATAKIVVNIDRTCPGCEHVPEHVLQPQKTDVAIAAGVVVGILIIMGIVIFIICFVRRRHHKKRPPHDPNANGDSSGYGFTPPPVTRAPLNGGPPPYKDQIRFGVDPVNVTSSDISDQSHSASSGRGSAEEEEDEEIRMINSNSQLNNSQMYNRRKQMPDSGIQQDDDTLSEPSVQNHQEYLARLGIDTTKIGKPKPKANQIAHSVESMHHFSDEGGGEGNVDMGHSDYDKMTDMETDEEVAMIDRNKDLGFHEPDTQHAGSLSSVINSEEEFSGSYNWDYLLNWGPQYQPLAHVFAEIAKLKDDSAQPRKHPVRTVPQRQINTGLTRPKEKTGGPPPMITNAPPKAFAPRPSHSSSGSSSHPNSARASTMNISLPSLPRSPISYDSNITSPAMTPSFTPSLSPLATGSPSPVVSAHGSGRSSGHNTPGKGVSKNIARMGLSASSESEQEFRI